MVAGTQRRGYTYKTLAETYGKSPRTWRRRVAEGDLVAVKDKQTVIILQEDLDRYFAKYRHERGGESESTDANQ